MRGRLLVLLAAAAALLGTALVAVPSAQAETPPTKGIWWFLCTDAADEYCIESVTADGVSVTPGPIDGQVRDFPFFAIGDAHNYTFGVRHDVDGDGGGDNTTFNVDPDVVYEMTVRTGTFRPREIQAFARNGAFSIGGSPSQGWRAKVQFQGVPVHNNFTILPACIAEISCGDSSSRANELDSQLGKAVGAIVDHAEPNNQLSATEIAQRTGMFRYASAQDENTFYNKAANALTVQLASPHRKVDGTPVTDGVFEIFIPNKFLIEAMHVPNPAALTSSSFAIKKNGAQLTPYAITVSAGGVKIKIANISYSRPVYTITPKPKPPGKPRITSVTKLTGAGKVTFLAPIANGNKAVDRYQAACQTAGKPFKAKLGTKSPITVTGLSSGKALCKVRAHNSVGWGEYGSLISSK